MNESEDSAWPSCVIDSDVLIDHLRGYQQALDFIDSLAWLRISLTLLGFLETRHNRGLLAKRHCPSPYPAPPSASASAAPLHVPASAAPLHVPALHCASPALRTGEGKA